MNQALSDSIQAETPNPCPTIALHPNGIDLTGKRFGRLVVIRYLGKKRWLCRCDCGNEKSIDGSYLRDGSTRSCRCLRVELFVQKHTTHGKRRTSEWATWSSMRQRCNNPKSQAYKNYGGRGIRVCSRWSKFENFIADMGNRPGPDYSLDRIDNDGNYEPSNCRWVKRIDQERNKRSNTVIQFRGEKHPVSVWAEMLGISPGTLYDRLDYGWSVEKAILTPIRKRSSSNASDRNI